MIPIKVFLKNKKLLIAVSAVILLDLLEIVWQYIGIRNGIYGVILSATIPIGFLFVVGAFMCNFNGKVQYAIVCAVVALVIRFPALLRYSFLFSDCFLQVIVRVLSILPEISLLIFLLKRKRNTRKWSCIAWGAVFLPVIASWILKLLSWGFYWEYLELFIALVTAIPLGFVYYFGFTGKSDATYTRTVAQSSPSASYLEEYKRKRMNGGK